MLQRMDGLPLQGISILASADNMGGRPSIFPQIFDFLISREELLLELVSGLASGLHHLHQAGIYHGAVCARNVFMVGETGNDTYAIVLYQWKCSGAKLGGFGMSTWCRSGEQPDCTRWMVRSHLLNT